MVDCRLLLAARGDGFGAGDFDAGVVHDHIEAAFAQAPHEAVAFGGVAAVRDHLFEVGGVEDHLCNDLAADGAGVGGGRNERQRADVGRWAVAERETGWIAAPVRAAHCHGDMEVVAEAEAGRPLGCRGAVAGPCVVIGATYQATIGADGADGIGALRRCGSGSGRSGTSRLARRCCATASGVKSRVTAHVSTKVLSRATAVMERRWSRGMVASSSVRVTHARSRPSPQSDVQPSRTASSQAADLLLGRVVGDGAPGD